MGILLKESQVVSEEEYDNDKTIAKGREGGNEGVWMDREDKPPDDIRYNIEGKKNRCVTQDHVEDSFEASNHNTSKVRSKSRNTIV